MVSAESALAVIRSSSGTAAVHTAGERRRCFQIPDSLQEPDRPGPRHHYCKVRKCLRKVRSLNIVALLDATTIFDISIVTHLIINIFGIYYNLNLEYCLINYEGRFRGGVWSLTPECDDK
jgi:hypothetical protein